MPYTKREGVPYNHTDTSADSAHKCEKFWASLSGRCFRMIRDAGKSGKTCDEIEVQLDARHQKILSCITRLKDKGHVVDSGLRRITRADRKAIVWIAVESETVFMRRLRERKNRS